MRRIEKQSRCEKCGCDFMLPRRGPMPDRIACVPCRRGLEKEEKKAKQAVAVQHLQCKGCGVHFRPPRTGVIYCSAKCRGYARNHRYAKQCRECSTAFKTGDEKAETCSKRCARERQHQRDLRQCSCRWCKQSFMASNPKAAYCTRRCNDRARDKRRKLYLKAWGRMRNSTMSHAPIEIIDPADVFARDGWVCWLCDTPVDRDVKHPHPLAATLDHVIPISKGGVHSTHNVRCAHSECNARRNNRDTFASTCLWRPVVEGDAYTGPVVSPV